MNAWLTLQAERDQPAEFFLDLTGSDRGGEGADSQHHSVSGHADEETVYGGNQMGLILASICFAIILAAIGYGIYLIVAGT